MNQIYRNILVVLLSLYSFSCFSQSSEARLERLLVDDLIISGFHPDIHDYVHKVAFGHTKVPQIEAIPIDSNAYLTISQSPSLLDTAIVTIFSSDSSTNLTYRIKFQQVSERLYILLVGANDSLNDQIIRDSLQLWGYNVWMVNAADHSTKYYESGNYDMVFFTSNATPESALEYKDSGFPLPAIVNNPDLLEPLDLGKVNPIDSSEIIENMTIVNVDHRITRDQYTSGQSIKMFENDHPDFSDDSYQRSFQMDQLTIYSTFGRPEGLDDPSFVLIEDFPPNSKGIEIIINAIGPNEAIKGTADYWHITRRSVWYLFDDYGCGCCRVAGRLASTDCQPPRISDIPLGDEFNITPNPVSDHGHIEFTLEDEATVQFEIFNLSGQVLKTLPSSFYSADKHSIPFDVSDLPNGIYFLKLQRDSIEIVKRLVVKR